jgi:hypothetical protein
MTHLEAYDTLIELLDNSTKKASAIHGLPVEDYQQVYRLLTEASIYMKLRKTGVIKDQDSNYQLQP